MDIEKVIARSTASIQKEDLRQLFNTLKGRKFKTVVEIGTGPGFSLLMWADAFIPEVAVGIEPDPLVIKKLHQFVASSKEYGHLVGMNAHMLEGKSQDEKVLKDLNGVLSGGRLIDFLFIDGDHNREAVLQDWLNFNPLMKRPGSVVVFHDIDLFQDQAEVKPIWRELKKDFRCEEIRSEGSTGMGVLFL